MKTKNQNTELTLYTKTGYERPIEVTIEFTYHYTGKNDPYHGHPGYIELSNLTIYSKSWTDLTDRLKLNHPMAYQDALEQAERNCQ